MKKVLRALAVFGIVCSAGSALGETLGITHEPPACAAAGGRLLLEASLPASSSAVSLRVYFRGVAEGEEYFLEMRESTARRYQAVLPRLASGVEAISYRFVARNVAAYESTSAGFTVAVTSSCAAAALGERELRYAENLVLGRTGKGDAVLEFECEGIVAQISANGELSAASCGGAIEASSESGPTAVSTATRAGVARVTVTDRSRRVVSRSRP